MSEEVERFPNEEEENLVLITIIANIKQYLYVLLYLFWVTRSEGYLAVVVELDRVWANSFAKNAEAPLSSLWQFLPCQK